jgi:hypothetical protein
MVTCSIGDADSIPGVKAFDIEIDPDEGLTPGDVPSVIGFPSGAEDFTGRVVQVNVYGVSTTNRRLLKELVDGVAGRLKRWGLEPAFNIHVPRHECRPPLENRPFTEPTWTCPECETVWEVRPRIDPENPPIATAYDFATGTPTTPSRWIRQEEAD